MSKPRKPSHRHAWTTREDLWIADGWSPDDRDRVLVMQVCADAACGAVAGPVASRVL